MVAPSPPLLLGAANGDWNRLFKSKKVKFSSAVSWGSLGSGVSGMLFLKVGQTWGQQLVLVKPCLGLQFWRCDSVSSVITALSCRDRQHRVGAAAGVWQKLCKGNRGGKMNGNGFFVDFDRLERDYISRVLGELTPMAL